MAERCCPVCADHPLTPRSWHDVTVDICDQCHGIWCDFIEMKDLEESDTLANIDQAFEGTFQMADLTQSMGGARRHCPNDATVMERHEWQDGTKIVLDFCPHCLGTWLDAGELEGYVEQLKTLEEHPLHLTAEQRREFQKQHDQREDELDDYLYKAPINPIADALMGGKLRETIRGFRRWHNIKIFKSADPGNTE